MAQVGHRHAYFESGHFANCGKHVVHDSHSGTKGSHPLSCVVGGWVGSRSAVPFQCAAGGWRPSRTYKWHEIREIAKNGKTRFKKSKKLSESVDSID